MGKLHTQDWEAIAAAMDAREEFATHGELSGRPGPVGFLETGRLPTEWRETVSVNADYAVFSYRTPIAWHESGIGWVRPLVKYSRTTTNHQNTIDAAIGRIAPGPVELYKVAYEGAYIRE